MRLYEYDDEELEIMLGARRKYAFTGSPEETIDFWNDLAAREYDYRDFDREPLEDGRPGRQGDTGYRHPPHFLDERDDWN